MQTSQSTAEAFYIVIGVIVSFVVMFAAFITACAVIWTKFLKPIRDQVDNKLFKPLEDAVLELAGVVKLVKELVERVSKLEENAQQNNTAQLAEIVKELQREVRLLKWRFYFRDKHHKTPIFILDGNGNCVRSNNALCELIDADSAELENKDWIQKIVAEQRLRVQSEWRNAYDNRTLFDSLQTLMVRGERKNFRIYAEPFIDEDKVYKFVGTVTEINEKILGEN